MDKSKNLLLYQYKLPIDKRVYPALVEGRYDFMEIPIAIWQFLAGGMGGLVRGIVGVTKAQTFNPDAFKFQCLS